MTEISKLKGYLIKRFILMIILISIAEYVMLKLVNLFFPPVVSYVFFDGADIATLKTSGVIISLAASVGSVIIGLLEFILPSPFRLTVAGIRRVIENRMQDILIQAGGDGGYITFNTGEKLMLVAVLTFVTALLVFPYAAGAFVFSKNV